MRGAGHSRLLAGRVDLESLHLLALDPVSETISDEQSYGFRKARSTHDAIAQCYLNARFKGSQSDAGPRRSAEWVLEADMQGCFDNIDHDWLIANVPMDRIILRKWLNAGYMEGNAVSPTQAGTPQGGIISPVLANFALADDFVITALTRELLETTVKPAVEKFLAERGLTLSPEKTKITHITEGYDSLGQNVRRYGSKLLIKPAKKNVRTFLRKVRDLIKILRPAPQLNVIEALNPVINGWARYHRHVVSQKIFTYVDSHIWFSLWQWAKRRHPKKTSRWIVGKYFHRIEGRSWVLAVKTNEQTEDGKPVYRTLRHAAKVPIERHRKIKSDTNPYDPKWEEYFEQRASGA